MKKISLDFKLLMKKYYFFIILIVVIFILGVIAFFSKYSRPEETEPAPSVPSMSEFSAWQKIAPGETTEANLKNQFGEPLGEYQENEKEKIIEYSSDFKYYPHQVHVELGIITLIKEKISYEQNINLDLFLTEYGQPSFVAYEENLGNAYPLSVFLENGFGVAAHLADGKVLEIWYFQPTTEAIFMQTIGKEMSLSFVEKF